MISRRAKVSTRPRIRKQSLRSPLARRAAEFAATPGFGIMAAQLT